MSSSGNGTDGKAAGDRDDMKDSGLSQDPTPPAPSALTASGAASTSREPPATSASGATEEASKKKQDNSVLPAVLARVLASALIETLQQHETQQRQSAPRSQQQAAESRPPNAPQTHTSAIPGVPSASQAPTSAIHGVTSDSERKPTPAAGSSRAAQPDLEAIASAADAAAAANRALLQALSANTMAAPATPYPFAFAAGPPFAAPFIHPPGLPTLPLPQPILPQVANPFAPQAYLWLPPSQQQQQQQPGHQSAMLAPTQGGALPQVAVMGAAGMPGMYAVPLAGAAGAPPAYPGQPMPVGYQGVGTPGVVAAPAGPGLTAAAAPTGGPGPSVQAPAQQQQQQQQRAAVQEQLIRQRYQAFVQGPLEQQMQQHMQHPHPHPHQHPHHHHHHHQHPHQHLHHQHQHGHHQPQHHHAPAVQQAGVAAGAVAPGGVAARPAAGVPGAPGGIRRIQVALRIDLMLALKLGLMVFLFSQDGSFNRVLLLSSFAVFIYLYQTGVLAPFVQWLSNFAQHAMGGLGGAAAGPVRLQGGRRPRAPGAAAQPAGGDPAGAAGLPAQPTGDGQALRPGGGAAQAGPRGPLGVLVREIRTFVVGFITSLLPGFQPVDLAAGAGAAAAAAAQQQQGEDHPHED